MPSIGNDVARHLLANQSKRCASERSVADDDCDVKVGMHTKDSKTISALLDWAQSPVADMFPYALTLDAVHRCGKHFIAPQVLEALDQARRSAADHQLGDALLAKFLDAVLDKYDQKYNYISYTGLPLLGHVRRDVTAEANQHLLQHVQDCILCSLIGDALRFELNALDGGDSYLTEMRPARDLIERRINCALRSLAPALRRLGFDEAVEPLPLGRKAARVVQFCSAQALAFSQFILDASMLPVYVAHDEYVFIRVLQSLDMTFVSVSSLLECALQAFDQELPRTAQFIQGADAILQEGLKHFATLTTMQKDSFQTFREFTTGASAIQSVNYKRMQSLCRTPDKERLESIAYSSVPSLQQALQQGNVSLDDKLTELRCSGRAPDALPAIEAAMCRFSETMTRWSHSHYGIAKKYLGQSAGTGYTAGVPYLKMVRDLPVFKTVTPSTASTTASQRR
jgi:tryptophan 2,3-dioxygenase